ncbi:MAG TPA: amidohydrolase [Woeseiaceae bacterium]|nr:amidohydrolase [Woeseiaceae bacterium]
MRITIVILWTLMQSGITWADEARADRVLTNGKILTVDAHDSIAQAVAIRDGIIIAVGNNDEVEALAGPGTARIDLAGNTVTPGLIDTHVHFAAGGLLELTQIDLSYPYVKSVNDAIGLVAARAKDTAPNDWILGHGWDEGKLAEQRYLLASDLDAVSGDRPVWLMHTMGHYGVADSDALRIAGIDRNTPNPPGGVIDRDVEGRPTGVLKESAMALVARHIPPTNPEQVPDAIQLMAKKFNRECMTGGKDPGIGTTFGYDLEDSMETWRAYQEVLSKGNLTVRILALWRSGDALEDARELVAAIEPLGKPQDAPANARLISGGVKLFADGSGGARTAWLWDEWNRERTGIDKDNRGYPAIDALTLRDLFMFYHDADLHVAVHAIGDRAIDWSVTTMAMALVLDPQYGLRHSIVHANIPTDHAMDTMAWLQRTFDAGYPESQATFTWWIGDTYAANFGVERSHRLNPFQSFKQRGIQWAGGSDFDVTPFPARYGIWASMTREPLLGVYGKDSFGTGEAVDVRTALRSFTIWAAHQMFMEDSIGSIEVGKSADLAVWDTDLYTAQPDDIKNMACQMTLLDGEIVYEAR